MAWERAKSGKNPRQPWVDISACYDGDLETGIFFGFEPGDDYVKEYRFFWDTFQTNQVRVYLTSARPLVTARIRVFSAGQFGALRECGVPEGAGWTYFVFPTQDFDEVRIDFKSGHDIMASIAIHEIEAWVACGGPLGPICALIRGIGRFFTNLGDSLADWPLVGDALSAPFRSLGDIIDTGADTCCEASLALKTILDLLEGGITWEEISALILDHWPLLAPLIEDPIGYIIDTVSGLIPELPDWLDDPVTYITELVSGLIPELPDWLDDPLVWLTDTLEENFPLLYYLVVDPAGELLYLIAQLFELTPYQAQSPEFVVKSLFERYFPELYQLWRDPEATLWTWLLDKFEDIFEDTWGRFYYLAEHAIRFFWEGEW